MKSIKDFSFCQSAILSDCYFPNTLYKEETINKSFTQQKGGVYLFKNQNGKKENVMDVKHLSRNVGKVFVICNLTQ